MITIVGGTYHERCLEPYWNEIFGSGLRAVFAILSTDRTSPLIYHTLCDQNTAGYLQSLKGNFPTLKIKQKQIKQTVEFYYDHPLKTPIISPRPDTLALRPIMNIEGENVLAYGLIEGNFKINAEKVVYDPQSPARPIPFSATGSKAKKLVVVVNFKEAQKICNTSSVTEIKDFFFKKERVHGLIIKMGAKGAMLFEVGRSSSNIPVFNTHSIWPIGSGDVFSAMVFYKWINGSTLKDAAFFASRATAIYCNTKGFDFGVEHHGLSQLLIRKVPKKTVYLAGPFFTFPQRWLVNQVRDSLRGFGLNVFSPWHDVGYGTASDVVSLDIKGIDECGIVFAIVDGLDSGTLFEIGYAVSKGIPIVAYVQNESKDSIKMLEGTNCLIVDDFSTAVYKTFWTLAQNE